MKKLLISLPVVIALFSYSFAQNTEPQEHIIEKFDTLWDISDTRLEDPFLWPKLWSVNPHIENPDLIYPGSRLIIPTREQLMKMAPPSRKVLPFARKLPPVIKGKKSKFIFTPKKKDNFILDKSLFIASGWIDDIFPSVGTITYSPMGRDITGREDTVYIRLDDESMADTSFYVVRNIKTVRHPATNKKVGYQIRVAGIIDVTGIENKMKKANIRTSYEEIQIGDGLLPYSELEPPAAPEVIRTPDVNGHIIESHMNNYLLGEGDVVFLDKGENDGLEVGDVFSVQSDQPSMSTVGKIQVVALKPSTSSAVLLQASEELTVGLQWGK